MRGPSATHLLSIAGAAIAALTLSLALGQTGDAAMGMVTYQKYCASCHGRDGKGNGPVAPILVPRPRDHTNMAFMAKVSDQYLFDVTSKGGGAMGKSPLMPPAKTLPNGDIVNLVTYMRELARAGVAAGLNSEGPGN